MQRRFTVFANLLLAGLLAGCTAEVDMANMRDNTLHSTQIRSDQVTTIQDRVARLEEAEAERQRGLLQMTAALEGLRLEQRKLRGEIEESQHRQEQADDALDYRLAALDQRLRIMETRPATGGAAPRMLDPGSEPPLLEPGAGLEPPASPATPVLEPGTEPPLPTPEPETVAAEPPAGPGSEAVPEPPPTPGPDMVAAVPPSEPQPVVEPPATPAADSPEAIRLFQRARQDYQQGNYEVAIILFKQYLRQHPQSFAGRGRTVLDRRIALRAERIQRRHRRLRRGDTGVPGERNGLGGNAEGGPVVRQFGRQAERAFLSATGTGKISQQRRSTTGHRKIETIAALMTRGGQ